MPNNKVSSSDRVLPVRVAAIEAVQNEPRRARFLVDWLRSHIVAVGAVSLVLLVTLGVFASNGWLPRTDPLSGKRTGWFGREVPKNAPSSWNPFAPPDPTPTPQLSKEYIYAGSRLLAVEDANADAIPPDDLAVWRPSTGMWYVLGGNGTHTYYPWGNNGDTPAQGDYDGDGKTDFAVFRPGADPAPTWWIVRSSDNTYYTVVFGEPADKVVTADFDGDGKSDVAVWRPSNYYWYWQPSSTCTPTCSTVYYQFGAANDVPIPADFDGDGRDDVAIWRNSQTKFVSVNSSNAQVVYVPMGYNGDTPVCGDYDGDGKANYAVRHNADWIIMNAALTSTTTTTWQSSAGVAVPNDYDGDGIVDIAIWKAPSGPGSGNNYYWYIRQSHDLSTRTVAWGLAGDIPVPSNYRR